MTVDCVQSMQMSAHIVSVYHGYAIGCDRCRISCLHAHSISDLPMGNGPGLQHGLGDVFRALIPSFSTSGKSRIACLSRLRATRLRSHRN